MSTQGEESDVPSLTDDNAVLTQKAGAVFTVNSKMLY